MIWKNLWRRKTRTLLTILGIAIGVGAVVSLSAFGAGFATGFERMMSGSNADLSVVQKDAMISFLSILEEEVGDNLRAIEGVEAASGSIMSILQMPESPYFTVFGEDPRGFPIEHFRVVDGQRLSGRRQILIGRLTASAFNKRVGDNFKLNNSSFRVVGIYETGVNMEDGGAVIALEDAQRIFDRRGRVNNFSLKVRDARRIDAIKAEIETTYPELSANRSGDATLQSEALGMYRSMGWFLGMFAVIVGGLGMMNTTLMSVFERTREIGVLRALRQNDHADTTSAAQGRLLGALPRVGKLWRRTATIVTRRTASGPARPSPPQQHHAAERDQGDPLANRQPGNAPET